MSLPLRDIQHRYDPHAAGFSRRIRPKTKARLAVVDRFILDWMAGGSAVVELGVGDGRLLGQIQAPVRVGFDLSRNMARESVRRGLWAIQADQAAVPLADASVDRALSAYGSARYTALSKLAAEMARVLMDGGRFAIHSFPGRTLLPHRILVGRPWQSRSVGLFELDSTTVARTTLLEAGLWLDDVLLLRNLRWPPYYLRLSRRAPLVFGSHFALFGTRMSRRVSAQRQRVLAALDGGTSAVVTVFGPSMRPTFEIGDRLEVVPCDHPRRGDVVLLQGRNWFLVHRVLATLPGYLVHRGDAPNARPMLAARWRMLGRVSGRL